MSDFNFLIETALIKGALICAESSQNARYYLRGVLVEPTARGLAVVSTDGHRLFAARCEPVSDDGQVLPTEAFIIPSETIKKAMVRYKADTIVLRRDGDAWFLGDTMFQPIDGVFPDWRRAVPTDVVLRESVGTCAQFNPAYIGDLGKIAKLICKDKTPEIYHCGITAALVTFPGRNDVFCLVMPIRHEPMTIEALRHIIESVV